MPAPFHRFLFDQMVSVPALRALADAGVDVQHVLGIGLGGRSDYDVLQAARTSGRIVVTRNYQDYAPLVVEYNKRGVPFPGVLFLPTSLHQGDVGAHIAALLAWIEQHPNRNPVENTYGWLEIA